MSDDEEMPGGSVSYLGDNYTLNFHLGRSLTQFYGNKFHLWSQFCFIVTQQWSYLGDNCTPGPSFSTLMTLLVNETLKFQMLTSQICKYFLLKKCEKLLMCKSFSHFFNKKYQCIWL